MASGLALREGSPVLRRLRKIAAAKGGTIVGYELVKDLGYYTVRCRRGHQWRMVPQGFDQGRWCQDCRRAERLEHLEGLASERGGRLLSGEYVNEDSLLRYRCAAGHRFEQRAADTLRDHWCRICRYAAAGERRKAPSRARFLKLVAEKGGVALTEYVNSQSSVRLRCAAGHVWQTVAEVILSGGWCAPCGHRERREHPETRRGVAGRLYREVVVRLESIVKERGGQILPPGYRGYHTTLPVRCKQGHTWPARPQGLEDGVWCPQCREDEYLASFRALAEAQGGELLSTRCSSANDRLEWRCAVGHRFRKVAATVKIGGWCPHCRAFVPGELERMQRIARERGGECLSERYVDAFAPLRFRCGEGHEWRSNAGDIVMGRWCKVCGWWKPYSRRRLSLADMRATAAERGGQCLSKEYNGNKVRLRWRCARRHEWMAHPNRVRQGSWCPVCSHSARGTLEGMKALAVERGGRLISRAWDNHSEPLTFACARGHRFRGLGTAVKAGVWCAQCPPPAVRPRVATRRARAAAAKRGAHEKP